MRKRKGPEIITGYKGLERCGRSYGSTEGEGLYVATTVEMAAEFGEVIKIQFRKPKNPLIAEYEDLPLLALVTDDGHRIFEPIEAADTEWIQFNKLAFQQSGCTDENYDVDLIAKHLTRLLLENGYDAVYVMYDGPDGWYVLLDNNLHDRKSYLLVERKDTIKATGIHPEAEKAVFIHIENESEYLQLTVSADLMRGLLKQGPLVIEKIDFTNNEIAFRHPEGTRIRIRGESC